jgi:hypothetical protein
MNDFGVSNRNPDISDLKSFILYEKIILYNNNEDVKARGVHDIVEMMQHAFDECVRYTLSILHCSPRLEQTDLVNMLVDLRTFIEHLIFVLEHNLVIEHTAGAAWLRDGKRANLNVFHFRVDFSEASKVQAGEAL